MDFLLGLQKALAQGITKEEYTDIWKKETELKIYNSKIQNISSEGSTSEDMKSVKDCAEESPLMPLLKQIAEKQDKIQHQQISIQQQLRHLQIWHERDQQKLQQQFEEAQKGLSEKVLVIEASLANLQPTLEACVRQTARSESLDIQEKCSVLSQTFCNHILEEMRKVTGARKTVYKAEKGKVIAEKESQMLKKPTAKDVTARAYRKDDTDVSNDLSFSYTDDESDIDEKMETLLMEIQTDAGSDRSSSSALDDESSNSLKDTLRYELNTFLVNVQKLLLKPINSEDVSYHIIERIKQFLQGQKKLTTEQLLNVQTTITSDVQARLNKVEMCLKNEISKIVSILELNEQSDCQMNMILEEIENIKSFLSSELPSRIVSHPKWAAVFENRSYVKVGDGVFNQAGVNRSDYSPDESYHIERYGRNKHGCSVSDGDMQAWVEDSSSDQVQAIILMLSIYVLMLLTGCNPITSTSQPKEVTQLTGCNPTIRERTLSTSQPRATTPFLLHDDTAGQTKRGKTKAKRAQHDKDLPRHLTDEHLQLMFGQHKEANYLCDLNLSTLSSGEEVCLKLKDIAPGYNLQLKALLSENKNLNFLIQAISGPQDDKLLWPATFSISLILVNKRPLATSKPNNWHSFTKSKSLFKPNKMIGQSTAIPLCYFRDDILNSFVYDDTLTLKVSVNYVRKEDDPDDPQNWCLPGE